MGVSYGWKRWAPDGKTYTAMIPETPPIFHCKVNVDNWEDTRGMMIVAAYNTANILCEAREVKRQIQESVSR